MFSQYFNSLISWYLDSLNYGTITLLMAVESSFLPLPSELVIPPAALQAATGKLNIYLVILFSTIGCVLGALFNYMLSITLGRKIIYAVAKTRWARIFFIKPESIEKSEQYFLRHGRSSTFIGRLVPGVRHLISIPAGLSRMNIGVFVLYTFIGSAIWNAFLAIFSYVLCIKLNLKDYDSVVKQVTMYSKEISYGLLALGAAFVIYLVVKYIRKKE